jgi:hypothetical protein
MTKQEVLTELKQKNEFDSSRKTDTWIKAFDLYNAAHPYAKKQPNCGSCFSKVRSWLIAG